MKSLKKLSNKRAFIMFAIPSIYFYMLTKFLTPYLTSEVKLNPALSWFITGYLVFLPLFIAAVLLTFKDTKERNFGILLNRLRIKPLSKSDMKWSLIGICATLLTTGSIMALSGYLTSLLGLAPLKTTPSFMEFQPLLGAERLYLLIWFPMFFFNIVGEQMLWQGYILPRQEITHGNTAWIVNSFLWLMFHLCFGPDLIIVLLPSLFIITYIIQRTKNTSTGMIIHAILNGPMFIVISLGLIH